MKKNCSFLFLALCLFAYSCRKDNKPSELSGDLNGTWLITKKHYNIYAIPSVFSPSDHLKTDTFVKSVTFNVDLINTDKQYAIFKSDGTAALLNFPLSFNNERPPKGDTAYFTYKRVNNLIYYYLPENDTTRLIRFTILSLQSKSLEMELSYISNNLDNQISGLPPKYYYQFEDDFYTRQ
jgi:hypothetical protein